MEHWSSDAAFQEASKSKRLSGGGRNMENYKKGGRGNRQIDRESEAGSERAKNTRPTSAPAPSQPTLFSAQEMALCRHRRRRWCVGRGVEIAVPTIGQLRARAQAKRMEEGGLLLHLYLLR